jgi:arsenate reductase
LPAERREDWGLSDPTGQPDEMFLETISTIEEKILELKENLKGA